MEINSPIYTRVHARPVNSFKPYTVNTLCNLGNLAYTNNAYYYYCCCYFTRTYTYSHAGIAVSILRAWPLRAGGATDLRRVPRHDS